jgi:hypothetical protein
VIWFGDIAEMLRTELGPHAAKAQRLLGWRPRPAIEIVADSARCLLAFGSAA